MNEPKKSERLIIWNGWSSILNFRLVFFNKKTVLYCILCGADQACMVIFDPCLSKIMGRRN
jgi:hypothetical protein